MNSHDSAKDWLGFVEEPLRKSLPLWGLLVSFILLAVVAWAISVITIAFMGDFDRTTQNYVGFAAGVVLAIILGIITHHAGASLYRRKRYKAMYSIIIKEGGEQESISLKKCRKIAPNFNVYPLSFFRSHAWLLGLLLYLGALIPSFVILNHIQLLAVIVIAQAIMFWLGYQYSFCHERSRYLYKQIQRAVEKESL